jgi:hypothetical protein
VRSEATSPGHSPLSSTLPLPFLNHLSAYISPTKQTKQKKRNIITPLGHLRPRSPPLSPLRFASYRSHLHWSPSGHPRPFPPHLSPLLRPSFPASVPPLLTSLPFLSSVL